MGRTANVGVTDFDPRADIMAVARIASGMPLGATMAVKDLLREEMV